MFNNSKGNNTAGNISTTFQCLALEDTFDMNLYQYLTKAC